jgi:hypothetical protein
VVANLATDSKQQVGHLEVRSTWSSSSLPAECLSGLEDYLVFTFFPADCYEVLLLTGEGGFAWIYSE